MQPEDFRGLTPLFYGHITPYGEFQLDMNKRINIGETSKIIKWPQDAEVRLLPHVRRNRGGTLRREVLHGYMVQLHPIGNIWVVWD